MQDRFGNTHVVPQAEDQNHVVETPAHLGQTTLGLEAVKVIEDLANVVTPLLSDGVAAGSKEILGILEDDAILDVETLDLAENTTRGKELGDDGDLLVGVNLEVAARSVVCLVALSPGVEVAAIRVAVSGITVGRVSATAVIAKADVVVIVITRVRSVSSGDGVCLPCFSQNKGRASEVTLSTYRCPSRRSKHRGHQHRSRGCLQWGSIRQRWPSCKLAAPHHMRFCIISYLATNELDVTRALTVAVAG